MNIKNSVILNAKNIYGWKTRRKIVVFCVDDYGNVRVDSKNARDRMDKAGLKILSRFDALDSLETREDLEILYETLSLVKDLKGQHAVFTPLAIPCNIDFEKMAQVDYTEYFYELLPQTFAKLKNYEGTWELWREGIQKKLMAPQFHGREHINLKVFKEKLEQRDHELLTALKNRSYTSISTTGYDTISSTAAFEFWDYSENNELKAIIGDGINRFKGVFGFAPLHFTPPGGREHSVLHHTLKDHGIEFIDTPWIKQEHQGKGKYKRIINYTGKKNKFNQTFLVRNVVFEPTHERGLDWGAYTMQQIQAAFQWNRPAVISSHRVNFCGHIDPANRKKGIDALRSLLKRIIQKWPDVEFMSSVELMTLVSEKKKELFK